MKKTAIIYLLLGGLSVLQVMYYYPKLPTTVATHFGADGSADSWASKENFAYLSIGIVVIIAILFLGITFLIPRLPPSMINLPNKEYWLAPERKKESFASVSACVVWMGGATIVLLLAVIQLSIRANLAAEQTLSGAVWGLIVLYGLFSIVSVVRLYLRFTKIPD